MKTILTFILSLFIISSQAQQSFYKHFEGIVGNNINVVMDLAATGEELGGYYYYYYDDNQGDDFWTHYGKSIPVGGKISDSSILEFNEFDNEVSGSTFKGVLKEDTISGTWSSVDGKKILPFEATESYPPGTMAFRATYLKDKAFLTGKANSPVAELKMSLLLPVDYPVANVADSVTACIYDDFFEKAFPGCDPSILLGEARDIYFKNYKTSNDGIYTEGATSFNWKKIQEIRVLHNENDILSFENYTYGYTGGAHGLSISRFRVIDLKDGHQVTLDEIFREDYRNDLRDIINSSARRKYKLERNQSLIDAGFFTEFIDAGPNYYVTKDGIGFYYNQYEVAPFALGPIDIFITYRELMRILNPESPVLRLIND
jgi:hypothetical protein